MEAVQAISEEIDATSNKVQRKKLLEKLQKSVLESIPKNSGREGGLSSMGFTMEPQENLAVHCFLFTALRFVDKFSNE